MALSALIETPHLHLLASPIWTSGCFPRGRLPTPQHILLCERMLVGETLSNHTHPSSFGRGSLIHGAGARSL